MKRSINLLAIGAAFGVSFNLHAAPVLVQNGNFETAGGATWGEAGGPDTIFSYPASGGNPGGYGVMTNSGAGFGVLIANNGEIPLVDLGLTAGESYIFTQDMILLSGAGLGKLKIEFYEGGGQFFNTGDILKSPVGDGSSWATYSYEVTIPSNADAIKVVPVAGVGSSIGFDNIGVDNTPVIIPPGPRIPNGDFETPAGAKWGFFSGGLGEHSVSFPATGGNPGGFAQISSTNTGYAGIASNSNSPLLIDTIGLVAGETYTFTMDMKIISGPKIGKFKVDFIPGPPGSSPEMEPTIIGDGSTWQNYSFDITLPENTSQILIVPLWGKDSVVGFDNIDIVVPEQAPFFADIRKGTLVSWATEGENFIYQPQGSYDQEEWDNIGPAIRGDTITSAFVPEPFPFYQVDILQEVFADAALNGGFEDVFNDPNICADSWICFSPSAQPPTWITTDFHSGEAAMRIAVINDATPTPHNSELQQNIVAAGGFITVGESYDFSFWAKQISSGVSYVQQYRVQWLAPGGAIVPGGTDFANFTGGNGVWEKISVNGLVAPDGAETAFIQIFGATGAVPGSEARGEVLIDDLSLATLSIAPYDTFDATTTQGVEISWGTQDGKAYQVKSSTELKAFVDFGTPIVGDGARKSVVDPITTVRKHYEVVETPAR